MSSVYGSVDDSPYALSLLATTTRWTRPACTRHASRQVVGAADVRLERRQRTAQRCRDDGLRREVEYRVDFVLDHRTLDGLIVFERAVDDGDARPEPAADQLRLRVHIADEADDERALLDQLAHEPRTDDAR